MAQDNKTQLYTLYQSLKADNYDVPDTYESFERTLTAPGNEGMTNRMTLYNSLKSDNYDVPETYESFSNTLFVPTAAKVGEGSSRSSQRTQSNQRTRSSRNSVAPGWGPVRPEVQRLASIDAGLQGPSLEDVPFLGDKIKNVAKHRDAIEGRRYRMRWGGRDHEVSESDVVKAGGFERWARRSGINGARVYMSDKNGKSWHVAVSEVGNKVKDGWAATVTGRRTSFPEKKKQPAPPKKSMDLENTRFLSKPAPPMPKEGPVEWAEGYEARKAEAEDAVDMEAVGRQVMGLGKSIDTALEARSKELLDAKYGNEHWWSPLVGSAPGAPALDTTLLNDPRYRALSTARSSLDNAERLMKEARAAAGQGKGDNWRKQFVDWLQGAGRGFVDSAGDLKTWDMGVMDVAESKTLYDALKTADKGGKLTAVQQQMLDAKALEMIVEQYLGGATGRGYKAGQITAESIPFMLEMIVNPASSVGSAATARLTRYAIKRYGTRELKNKAKRWIAAKVTTGLVGNAVGAGVMAATTGAPAVVADAIDRKIGTVTGAVDDEGRVRYGGHEGGEDSWVKALGKAYGARSIEEFSEMMFGPANPYMKTAVGGAMKKIGLGKLVDAAETVSKSGVGEFLSKTKWNGLPEEYLEEVGSNVLNALVVGDMTLDTAEGTGVFNADVNLETLEGLSLMSGGIVIMKTGSYPIERRRAMAAQRRELTGLSARAGEAMSSGSPELREKWEELRLGMMARSEEDAHKMVGELLASGTMTREQKSAVLNYAAGVMKYRGMKLAAAKLNGGADAPTADNELTDSYTEGYATDEPAGMAEAQTRYEYQRERAEGLFEADVLSGLDDDGAGALASMAASGNYSQDELEAAQDYVNARTVRDGIIQRVNDDIDEEIERSDAEVKSRVNNVSGQIQPAVMGMDDREVYVVGGRLAVNDDGTIDVEGSDNCIVVRDAQTGEVEMTDPKSLGSVMAALDPEEVRASRAEEIRQKAAQGAVDSMNGTLALNAGDVVEINDGGGLTQVTVVGPAVDSESGMAVDGQVRVKMADGTETVMTGEQLQQMADVAKRERVATVERERQSAQRPARRPQWKLNDEFTIMNESGIPVHGVITGETDEDGKVEIYTEEPLNGNKMNRVTPAELEEMLDSYNGERITLDNGENDVSLQPENIAEENGNRSEQNHDERAVARQTDGGGVADDSAGSLEGDRDRGDIRVYETGLVASRNEHTNDSERTRRNAEAERLIGIARANKQYWDQQAFGTLGERIPKRGGESEVYIDRQNGRVYKIKDPYAKSPMKGNVQPEDAIYEHLVHNKYFPETRYRFEGISEEMGDVRIVLSQGYVDAVDNATDEQIEVALAEKGLYRVDNYTFGNDEITVTDVTGDNALLGADGKVYFIDPIINFRKPVKEIVGDEPGADLGSYQSTQIESTPSTQSSPSSRSTLTEGAGAEHGAAEAAESTPLQRIPRDESGEPVFERAESPEHGWDALVEFAEGDAATAKEIADTMAEEKRKAYEKAQKQKPKGKTPTEILASKKAISAELAQAEQEYNLWQQMANVEQRRQDAIRAQQEAEARQRAAERAEAEKAEREAREEAARLEREALEGIPEWHLDTPENARKRGVRRFSGQMFTRQEPVQGVVGKEVEVKFSQKDLPKGHLAVIEASQLQPSHIQGQRNPMFFIEEAQPKNRAEAVSMFAAKEMAEGIRPQEITGSATAYTGAPTVNTRGEVIQGNNRSDALRFLWENKLPEQQQTYKQYLIDNAEQFGLDPEAVDAMQQPVLVNMLDVDDAEAIRLGQMTAQDTESGGVERIKPKNVAQKLGEDMRIFASQLLRSGDEESSFGQLVDRNGTEVLKWMAQKGAITNTQYQSAFDSKGNLTAEAKNDLQKVLYQAVFKGGSQQLEEMFDALPAKAQRAILSTAFRDMDSPFAGKMLPEIQASIAAFNQLMNDPTFAAAKKMEEVLRVVEGFKRSIQLDDRFEQYMPADNFSNFALHLAAMYKANDMSQSTLTSYFNQMYDLAQGKKAATLFEEADTTEYPLADVIKQVLNIDYKPAKNGNNNVANGGADVALRNQDGQGGELRGNEPPASGEQNPTGTEPSDRGAGTSDDSRGVGIDKRGGESEAEAPQTKLSKEDATDIIAKMEMSAVNDPQISLSPESWQNSFGLSNSIDTPLGKVKMGEGQYQKLVDKKRSSEFGMVVQTLQDPDVVFIEPSEAKEGQTTERDFSYVFVKTFIRDGQKFKYYTSVSVLKDGMEVSVSSHIASKTAIMKKLQGMERAYTKQSLLPNSSEWHLAEHPTDVPDLLPTQGKSDANVETSAKTEPQQPNNAVSSDSSLSTDEQSGTSSIEPNGESTVSDRKVNNSATEKQGSGQESSVQPSDNKGEQTIQTAVEAASAQVNTEPTPAQAEAGNYKKGHVTIGEFDITIENPAGSVRKGVDADGKEWSNTMANAYGYIKGTEGVDGDHIDVFLHSDMDQWNGRKVFVVDQTNTDGSFDEHKVMLGFNDKDEAMTAYLANYDKTWADTHPGLRISETNIEDFNKWVQASHRKTKPFADYTTVSKVVDEAPVKTEPKQPEQPTANIGEGYKIESKPYTNKQGKTLDTYLVTFDRDFSKEELSALRAKAKALKGWYDRESKGWMLRSSEDAKAFADEVTAKSEDEVADDAPLSMADMEKPKPAAKPTESPMKQVDVEGVFDALKTKGETKLNDHAKPVEEAPKPKKRRWISNEDADEFDSLRKDLRSHFGKDGDIVQEAGAEYGKPKPKQMDAFDRHVFNPDYQPSEKMSNAQDVAKFLSSHRLGDRSKVSVLVCNNQNQIVANVHTTHTSIDSKGLAEDIIRAIGEFGGMHAFLYGDFEQSGMVAYRNLTQAVKERSGGVYNLLDVVRIEGNHTWSAQDNGYVCEPGSEYGALPEGDIRFREVEDDAVLKEFAEGKTVKAYRTMQVIDGKLYSPMATKVGGKATPEIKLGVPEQAEEHPEIIKKTIINKDGNEQGIVVINKGLGKGSLKVAYNPYVHTSRTVLNDQFSSAYKRPNLVTVEVEVPESELKSGYRADKAKNSVGEMPWHSGTVSGQLAELGQPRRVILTRYDRPVRIVPFKEVAAMIAEQLDGTDIAIPYNVVQPQVRAELERLGVAISEEATGTVDNGDFGEAEYVTDQEVERINAHQQEMAERSPEAKRGHAEKMAAKLGTPIKVVEDVSKVPAKLQRARGWYEVGSGRVVVVLPNNASVEDVAETVFHEVVAHKGLREMVGKENYDAFCDEVYDHLKGELKEEVDRETTRRFMREPEKGLDYHRRVAVDELFGRMAEKGFEDFTRAERGIWAKLKEKVMEAINKFLGSLKLPKWVKLGDNELRYMLWRSHERLRNGASSQPSPQGRETGTAPGRDYVEVARDVAKREELGLNRNEVVTRSEKTTADRIEESFNDAISGKIKGKPVEIGRLTDAGREYLEKLSGVKMKEAVSFVLNPSDLVHIYREHFGANEKDKGNNIPLSNEDIRAIADVIANPERIIFGKEPDGLKRNLFYFLSSAKEGAYNLLEIYGDRKGNLTAKTFYKTRKGVSQRVLSFMKSEHLTSVTDGATLSNGAKLPKIFENPTIEGGESLEYRLREGETGDIWKDQSVGLEERITNAAIRLSNNHRDNLRLRNDAVAAIGGNLTSLRKAMAAQKHYDQSTVKRVADLARILLQSGYLSELTSGEVQRLLSAVKNSVGRKDVDESVQKIMDLMVSNQLRNGEVALRRLLTIKGSKVDARGVEVQGALDVDGQRTLEVVKKAMSLTEDDIIGRMAEALNRMGDIDQTIADHAALEYTGLQMALEYVQNIAGSKAEVTALRDSLETAKEDKDAGRMTDDAYKQFVEATEDAIRKNKIERAEAYFNLVGRLSDSMRGSIENAKAFREAEKARVNEIHHNANSDMEGRPSNEHHKDDWKDKLANNSMLFAPLGTFDQILRVFGNKSANGEGYLWNRFMRGWIESRNKELRGVKDKFARLDEKVAEIFAKAQDPNKNKGTGKVKSMGDMIRLERKLPKATVSFWDGGEMREHELTQGNLLYIYMVDKMTDGRMKLRSMGITEDDVANVEKVLDPRFKALGDWLQEEFLVETRNEYNETHKRMFGASMAAIENYFPLKILANARIDKEEDVNQQNRPEGITTKTGSIIKRRVNNLALDITGADALSIILDHITQMEHWNAYAEWNRDLNTLRTYKRFRNQVMNMTTIYGGGRQLWEKFNDLCLMAAGEYRPPVSKLNKSAVNLAKGVTAAKVSFRMFTALKQLLSAPAYLPEVSVASIAKSIANPYGDFKWCLENMPIFRERWQSRISGDPRLLKSDMDWKMWRSRVMEISSRIGMTPNAFVDAVTVSIGARAMYQTRLKQYVKEGYPTDAAEKRAMQDATILFNQTQQSSESPFLSTMQVDKDWLSTLFTAFRNSSMSYTRQGYDALRNLKRNLTPGQRSKSIEFMTKQILRDWEASPQPSPQGEGAGFTEETRARAERAAKKRYNRQLKKDVLRLATFGFILELAWNLGPYLPYLIFGDDDDEKDAMWDDALTHSYFGSIEGLTGGDVMSSFGNMWASGEWSSFQLTKDMPLASDLLSVRDKFVNGKNVEALNDIFNLAMQMGVGMNPQSITDTAIAITDACGDDPALSHEAAILVMRILQVPQSQLDKLYFDEIGLSGTEASKLSPGQLARRYAEYKVMRGTPLQPWTWTDEERLGKYEDKATKRMKELLTGRSGEAVNNSLAAYDEEWSATNKRIKELKKREMDVVDKAEQLTELYNSPEGMRYNLYKSHRPYLKKMIDSWLDAPTAEGAAKEAEAIITYKTDVVRMLDTWNNPEQNEAAKQTVMDAEMKWNGVQ